MSALTPFVTPGPAVSAQTPTRRVTFAQPSAANVAVCSWRTSTRRDVGLHAPVVEREEVAAREGEDGVDVVAAQHLRREPSAGAEDSSLTRSSPLRGVGLARCTRSRNRCERRVPRRRVLELGRVPRVGDHDELGTGDRVGHLLRHAEERLVLLADDDERRAARPRRAAASWSGWSRISRAIVAHMTAESVDHFWSLNSW